MTRKYTGPAKPVQVGFASWGLMDKIERVVFLLCLIVVACDVLWWRP